MRYFGGEKPNLDTEIFCFVYILTKLSYEVDRGSFYLAISSEVSGFALFFEFWMSRHRDVQPVLPDDSTMA